MGGTREEEPQFTREPERKDEPLPGRSFAEVQTRPIVSTDPKRPSFDSSAKATLIRCLVAAGTLEYGNDIPSATHGRCVNAPVAGVSRVVPRSMCVRSTLGFIKIPAVPGLPFHSQRRGERSTLSCGQPFARNSVAQPVRLGSCHRSEFMYAPERSKISDLTTFIRSSYASWSFDSRNH